VARFVATDQFNPVTGTIQFPGKQFYQRLVCRRIHRRSGDLDFQLGADGRSDFSRGRARLEFYGQQRAVRLRVEKIRKGHNL